MKNSCLMVIFNHRYDKNLTKIKALYENRFDDIYVLMPFYDGEAVDGVHIIPVFESSYQFHGYIAQAYEHIKQDYKHFVIIGDDLLLNPKLNQDNIAEILGLSDDASYIKRMRKIEDADGISAQRLYYEILVPFIKSTGTEYKQQIPSREEAFKICEEKFGMPFARKFNISNLIKLAFTSGTALGGPFRLCYMVKSILLNRGMQMPYPLFKIYSDFLVLSGKDMKYLCHLFGVFAAMGIFVEVAVPTAMAIGCGKIVCENACKMRGMELWALADKQGFEQNYNFHLIELMNRFEEDVIYYHPVKLSKWN